LQVTGVGEEKRVGAGNRVGRCDKTVGTGNRRGRGEKWAQTFSLTEESTLQL